LLVNKEIDKVKIVFAGAGAAAIATAEHYVRSACGARTSSWPTTMA